MIGVYGVFSFVFVSLSLYNWINWGFRIEDWGLKLKTSFGKSLWEATGTGGIQFRIWKSVNSMW